MDFLRRYEVNETESGMEITLFLNSEEAEFSAEFDEKKETRSLSESVSAFVSNRFSNKNIKKISVMSGAILLASFSGNQLGPFSSASSAAEVKQVQKNYQNEKYSVVSGDTLSGIGKRFGVSVSSLREINELKSDLIMVNQTLTLPYFNYTVQSGDYLSVLAKRFNTTVDQIKKINSLTSDLVLIGQTLKIPNSEPVHINSKTTIQTPDTYTVKAGDSLSLIAKNFGLSVEEIKKYNQLSSDLILIGQVLKLIPTESNEPNNNTTSTLTHVVVSGDNIWNLSVKYGIPQKELLKANDLTTASLLKIGQKLKVPQYNIPVKSTVSEKHGEVLDWWTEAQYVLPINKTFKITDFKTGKSFYAKRTIGANHADTETLSVSDTTIAKSIWGGFSWSPRAVLIEVDGRKLAASMSFMPHDVEYINNNGIKGHFDIHFKNSTRHKDGKIDVKHQEQVNIAGGIPNT